MSISLGRSWQVYLKWLGRKRQILIFGVEMTNAAVMWVELVDVVRIGDATYRHVESRFAFANVMNGRHLGLVQPFFRGFFGMSDIGSIIPTRKSISWP